MAGSIQQSLNQALFAGSYAIGSFQRTPAGQRWKHAQIAKEELKTAQKEEKKGLSAEAANLKKQYEAAHTLYELQPTQKHSDQLEEISGKQQKAQKEQEKRNIKQQLLSNDPNYQLRKDLEKSTFQKGEQKKQFKERIKILFDKKEEN